MRQKFDNQFNQSQFNKRQYAEFLNHQVQEKQQRKRENKIIEQATDINMMQIPRSRFQLSSIFDNSDLQKRQKLQQQLLEQDICNYNKMVADQKQLSKKNKLNAKSVDSQTTLMKFPKVSNHSEEHRNEITSNKITLNIPNLSKSYVINTSSQQQSPSPTKLQSRSPLDYQQITSSKNNFLSRDELEFYQERQREEIKKRNQDLEDIRRKMHEDYSSTKQQIASLIDFVKYNQQQQYQYGLLQKSLLPLVNDQMEEPKYKFLKDEFSKQTKEQQYFHYNEFLEQANEELKTTSNYIQMQPLQILDKNPEENLDFVVFDLQ